MFELYIDEVAQIANTIMSDHLDQAIHKIEEVAKTSGTVFIVGNGGSAAIASHLAVDLTKAGFARKAAIRAVSLTDNVALVTATSNDFSFEEVYSWQISQYGKAGDLLIAISSSGNSANIIEALKVASKLSISTVSLTGFDGGEAAKIAQIALIAKSHNGNYGPVEDSHSMICHYISRRIRNIQ